MTESGNGSNESLSRIIERIQKLLALAESANANEAAAAAAKASELLLKYELDIVSVNGHTPESNPEVVEDPTPWSYSKGTRTTWEVDLASAVAKHNRCRILISKRRIHWVGPKRILPVVQFMHAQLATRLQLMASDAVRRHIAELRELYLMGGGDPKFWHHTKIASMFGREHGTIRYRSSWLLGAASGIAEQLYLQRKAAEQVPATKALIVLDDRAVEQYIAQRAGKGTWRGSSGGGAGFVAGYETGKSLPIHSGLTGRSSAGQLKGR